MNQAVDLSFDEARVQLLATQDQINQTILGKEEQVKLCLTAILAKGHILLEDLPGMGKTTLSKTLSRALGLSHKRIQFTSDMMPSDITGSHIFDRNQSKFFFQPGPVFSQCVLADEINRASPKCQSALLEAMEERQVSIEGKTRKLPDCFFVIATQNPLEQSGTFPLPESQLDRFSMKLSLGYPDSQSEKQLLESNGASVGSEASKITPETLLTLQQATLDVHASPTIIDYVYKLLETSRNKHEMRGLSPRAGINLLSAAKAWALLEGRQHIIPEDVQQVLGPVCEHRLSKDQMHHSEHAQTLLASIDIF